MAYITAQNVLDKYEFDDTDAGPTLTTYIAEAEAFIERVTGRDFEADTETRYYTASLDADGLTLYLDDDFLAVGSDGITAGTDAIAATDYVTEPRNDAPYYALKLKDYLGNIWSNSDSDGNFENAISIHGIWGYSTDAPADIQWACGRLVMWMYKQRSTNADLDRPLLTGDGMSIMPAEVPNDVMAVLKHYIRRPIA